MKKIIKRSAAVFIVTAVMLSSLMLKSSAYVSLKLDRTAVTLMTSQTVKLEATVDTDETGAVLIWRSGDESVAKVDKDGNVTALAPGETDVSVSIVIDPEIDDYPDIIPLGEPEGSTKAVCRVTVEKTKVEGIALDRENVKLRYKSSVQLNAGLTPENAYDKAVKWYSSDTAKVKVDGSGKVTGTGRGSAVITAESVDGGQKAFCRVTVRYAFWQWLIVIFLGGWIWY